MDDRVETAASAVVVVASDAVVQQAQQLPPPAAVAPKVPLKTRLIRYYQKYNPTHISKVDYIMDLYDNDEAALFQDLQARYGPEDTADDSSSLAVATAPPADPSSSPAAPRQHYQQQHNSPRLASPMLHSQSDTLAMSNATVMDMPDASSPYHRSDSKRRFPSASGGGSDQQELLSPSHHQQQHQQTSTVYDGAFSPNRRRAPRTLGTLFSNPSGGDVVDTPDRQVWDHPVTQNIEGNAQQQQQPGKPHHYVATPSNTRSDTLISDVTSVVYRHDVNVIAKESARRIVDAAKKNASIGFLANTTSLVMQRSAAAEMYAQHLETLRNPVSYSSSREMAQHIRNQRLGITTAAPTTPASSHTVHASLPPRPPVPTPVRALQSTLNIDEMSSYRALADYQRNELARLESPEALLQASSYASQRSGEAAGGLFFPSWQAKPLHGKRITFEGDTVSSASGGAQRFPTTAAELARSRLRALQTSPLVSMQRARAQAVAARNRGYANFDTDAQQHYDEVADDPATSRPVGGGVLFDTSLDTSNAIPADSADVDLQPIDMICTECGMICKIVPGREHEFVHEH